MLPESSVSVILKSVRVLSHPLVIADVSNLIPEHVPAGINHRVIPVRLNDGAEGIDHLLQLRLRHIFVIGRFHIVDYRVADRVVTDPLNKLIRLVFCLIHVIRIGVKIYARPQTRRISAPHVHVEIRVHARIGAACLYKHKGYSR